MSKNLKQIFTVVVALTASLCAAGQTPDSAEALAGLIGRNDAVWEATSGDVNFLYFRDDGTGLRSSKTAKSADVRQQFVWKAISPTQLTLKFNRRVRLDTITVTNALTDNIRVKSGGKTYDYIASYNADNYKQKLVDMIMHPGGISERADEVTPSSLKRQWIKMLGGSDRLDVHGDKTVHFYVEGAPMPTVILDGMKLQLSNADLYDSEYLNSRKFHYFIKSNNAERDARTLQEWLAGGPSAFKDEGSSKVASLGTTQTGHQLTASIYLSDNYISLDFEFNKSKDSGPSPELQRELDKADKLIAELDDLLRQVKSMPKPSSSNQSQGTVNLYIPQTYPVATPAGGSSSGGSTRSTVTYRHCQRCYGTGVCQTCGGDGLATCPYRVAGATSNDYECPNCKQGHPRSDWGKCAICNGTGKLASRY